MGRPDPLRSTSKLVLLKAPESVVATEGESVTFSVEASGQPPLAYQWYWNQTPIAGAQSPSYTIASVASDDQGDYQVEITSGADTLLSPVATLSLWQTTQLNEALDQASLVFSTDEGISLGPAKRPGLMIRLMRRNPA